MALLQPCAPPCRCTQVVRPAGMAVPPWLSVFSTGIQTVGSQQAQLAPCPGQFLVDNAPHTALVKTDSGGLLQNPPLRLAHSWSYPNPDFPCGCWRESPQRPHTGSAAEPHSSLHGAFEGYAPLTPNTEWNDRTDRQEATQCIRRRRRRSAHPTFIPISIIPSRQQQGGHHT